MTMLKKRKLFTTVRKMMSLQITSLALITFISLLPNTESCNRYRYYGDPCVGYGQGKDDVCDTSRMLQCDYRTGTCQCPDFLYYFYDNYYSRCYHKVGTACQENFGGLSESWYGHGCPENSFCNPGTGYCACKPLYRQNYDGTGCFLNGGGGIKHKNNSILLQLGMGLLLLGFTLL